MLSVLDSASGKSVDEVIALLREESYAIQIEDIEMCRKIAEYGLSLLKPGDTFLTHCNAGPLATSKYGTAIGPAFLAKERGIDIKVPSSVDVLGMFRSFARSAFRTSRR
jgi:methylthioribose-1-phosphate isomerase